MSSDFAFRGRAMMTPTGTDFEQVVGNNCSVAKHTSLGLAYVRLPSDVLRHGVLALLLQSGSSQAYEGGVRADIGAHEVCIATYATCTDIVVQWEEKAADKDTLRIVSLVEYFDKLIDEVLRSQGASTLGWSSGRASADASFEHRSLTPEEGLPLKRVKPKTHYHAITAEDLERDSQDILPLVVIDTDANAETEDP
eukprot:TRINITY_DN72990_c0_g1_i1.p1 TRINITY_DN72990_c0_g1~~TRINITY_DN72990_c0_g1_i1.p1  ORF type:complete len:196 (-),score=25.03 TRINITY_DN72990_c0_g1_i1:183-770(-)